MIIHKFATVSQSRLCECNISSQIHLRSYTTLNNKDVCLFTNNKHRYNQCTNSLNQRLTYR